MERIIVKYSEGRDSNMTFLMNWWEKGLKRLKKWLLEEYGRWSAELSKK
jgi:hypothetical protein